MQLRIEQDTNAQSPDEMSGGDTGAFLVGWDSRNFYVPPPGAKGNFDPQQVINDYRKTHHIYMLEAYIHSGVRLALMNEGNFCDRQWDVSSNIGAIFLSKSEWKTKGVKALKYARAMVQEWNDYLCGDVWGYIIEDDEGHHIDSCWGFYGREYCEQEGRAALAHAQKHAQAEACLI